jgi:hypothetical protein
MKDEPLDKLDPVLDRLLEAERQAEAPAEALGRVGARLATAVPVAGAGLAGAAARHGWMASYVAGVATVAFVAGGATGAAVYAAVQKPPVERIVYVDRPAPPATETPAWVPAPPLAAPAAAASAVPALPPRAAPSVSTSLLSAERILLDSARGELTSGNAAQALVLLDSHAHRFPRAQLAEEREALVIQSLVALGRYDEARAAAARFKAATPGSLFLPAIEASVESIP